MGKEELDDDRDVAQQLDIERGQAPRQEAAARPKAADEGSQEAGAGDGDERELEREHKALQQIAAVRSEEHTSELQSLMRISYAVFCLKKKTNKTNTCIQRAQH